MKIETKAVEALLSGNHTLEGIGLAIGDRELVGVIGPNGSGKSTLAQVHLPGAEAHKGRSVFGRQSSGQL